VQWNDGRAALGAAREEESPLAAADEEGAGVNDEFAGIVRTLVHYTDSGGHD